MREGGKGGREEGRKGGRKEGKGNDGKEKKGKGKGMVEPETGERRREGSSVRGERGGLWVGWRASWKRGMYNPPLLAPSPCPTPTQNAPTTSAKAKETRESGAGNGREQSQSMDPRRHKDMQANWYQINDFLGTLHASRNHYEVIGMW